MRRTGVARRRVHKLNGRCIGANRRLIMSRVYGTYPKSVLDLSPRNEHIVTSRSRNFHDNRREIELLSNSPEAWRRSCGFCAQGNPSHGDPADRKARERDVLSAFGETSFIVASAAVKSFRIIVIAMSVLGGAATALSLPGSEIEIDRPWCGETPKGIAVGTCYMTVKNFGATADRLSAATSSVSGRVEFHEMRVSDGIMKMRPLLSGVEIPARTTVDFHARGYHVMLLELKAPLRAGTRIGGSLIFARSGSVPVEFRVESAWPSTEPSIHGHE